MLAAEKATNRAREKQAGSAPQNMSAAMKARRGMVGRRTGSMQSLSIATTS
jgi:hypothetical protein